MRIATIFWLAFLSTFCAQNVSRNSEIVLPTPQVSPVQPKVKNVEEQRQNEITKQELKNWLEKKSKENGLSVLEKTVLPNDDLEIRVWRNFNSYMRLL